MSDDRVRSGEIHMLSDEELRSTAPPFEREAKEAIRLFDKKIRSMTRGQRLHVVLQAAWLSSPVGSEWITFARVRWHSEVTTEEFVESVVDKIVGSPWQAVERIRLYVAVDEKTCPVVFFRYSDLATAQGRLNAQDLSDDDEDELRDPEDVAIGTSEKGLCILTMLYDDGGGHGVIPLTIDKTRRLHSGLGQWLKRQETH